MYLEHFGLTELPFTLTPNTAFFLDRGGYREALNVLLVALEGGEGFVKITGEVGTGKTLLCRCLLGALGADYVTAYLPNPALSPAELHLALATELGLQPSAPDAPRLLKQVEECLLALCAAGKRVVLIIDEAQTMPTESLEAVRLLGNLETERSKLLQVVLFGQPELDQRLAQPGLRQLRQRIGFGYRLPPLERGALSHYLQFRLQAAGYRGAPVFSAAAERELYRASGGVPRLVNILAHKSLLAAFGEGRCRVGRNHLRRAVADTEDARRRRSGAGWAVAAGLLATAASAWWLSGAVLA